MSLDLGLFQIGINREALETNTTLDPATDRVHISIMGRARLRPILLDRFFEVVPLDELKPDALGRSPHGEAVLPEGDQVLRRYEPPRPGDDILMNSVFSQRMGTLPTSEEFARILQDLFRREGGRRPPNS